MRIRIARGDFTRFFHAPVPLYDRDGTTFIGTVYSVEFDGKYTLGVVGCNEKGQSYIRGKGGLSVDLVASNSPECRRTYNYLEREKIFIQSYRGVFKSSSVDLKDLLRQIRYELEKEFQDINRENHIVHTFRDVLNSNQHRFNFEPENVLVALPVFVEALRQLSTFTYDRFISLIEKQSGESWEKFLEVVRIQLTEIPVVKC